MPRQKRHKQGWEDGLKRNVNKGGKRRGWSVSEHNGKTRLRLQFPKTGDEWPANAQTNLPYNWEEDSIDDITLLVNRIYTPVMSKEKTLREAIDDALGVSDKKAHEVVTPWPGIVAAFKDHKLNLGNRIAEKTFEASYGRYLNVALLHLEGRKPAKTGKELTERVLSHQRVNQKPGVKFGEPLTRWIDMPKSRLECCLALKKFLEFGVAEHRQPQAFLIPEREYMLLRGPDGKQRRKAVLSDDQMMKLIKLLPEPWANVVKVCRVYGVRPWEVAFIQRLTKPDGRPQLYVTKGKVFTTRGGVKDETSPRWLAPIPVNGTSFDLLENWDQLSWPPTISGKMLGNKLRLLPYWRQLMEEFEANGEWLKPYSMRDTFSVRSHAKKIPTEYICEAMGHSPEVHNRSYRTTEWEAVQDAYGEAG